MPPPDALKVNVEEVNIASVLVVKGHYNIIATNDQHSGCIRRGDEMG